MLASDLNNPEFSGATNPDALLHVEFYWHEPVDKWSSEVKSQAAGKRVIVKGPKQPFVRIVRPGDNSTIIETAVREEHKQRWPERWIYWQMAEGLIDDGEGIPGWRLEEWPHLQDKPDLLRELKFTRFHTVDQVAGASDSQVQRLGIGGLGLREQARVDLRHRVAKDAMEAVTKKDAEIAELKKQMDELRALVLARQPEEEKRGPGRPKKEVVG